MRIYQYKDYDHYVECQTWCNKLKLANGGGIYIKESVVQFIAERNPDAKFILCHGTRRGIEQQHFKKYIPDADVLGTEISDTATQFPMTVQHDFTKVNPDWVGKCDIIYSNSIDHSIDPQETLRTWAGQLSPKGRLYVEYCQALSICDPNDPLDITNSELEDLILEHMVIVETVVGVAKAGGLIFVCELKP
jgi:hypothetical protein